MFGVKRAAAARRSKPRRRSRFVPGLEQLERRWLLTASPFTHYDIGTPTLADIWVDPAAGNDTRSGSTRGDAVRTIAEAWNRIPSSLSTTGYRIQLVSGTYGEASMPTWWDGRHGTYQSPIIINAADGPGTVTLAGMEVHDVRYMYLIGLRLEVQGGGGDVLHFASCDHVLVRDSQLVGLGDITAYQSPQESLKVNQSQYVYIEDCDISGAYWAAVDYVATQYGHVIGSKIHHAGDWGMYFKGGSAYLTVEGNEIYDAVTGGFSAGQGTGFQYMVSPWLHYEAYDVKFVNNVIHDTVGAGFGVNGGYNILLAHNTLYRVGGTSHVFEAVHGGRSCGNPADAAICSANLAAGGWGTSSASSDQRIPNKHVYVYNNVIYNPAGYQSQWQQFAIAAPVTPSAGSNIPNPSRADEDLQIRGNIVWNGPTTLPLGTEDVAGLLVTGAQLRADNSINTVQPQLIDPAHGDFRPLPGGNVLSATTYVVPDFTWSDAPARPGVPQGTLSNSVPRDRSGQTRIAFATPGAYTGAGAATGADVAVSIRAESATITAGSNTTFIITVSNGGPEAAAGVTVSDVLPASFTYVSATSTRGTVSQSGGTVTANVGSMAVGDAVTIQVVVNPTSAGTFSQQVEVTNSVSDRNPGNNSASLDTAVGVASSQTVFFLHQSVGAGIMEDHNGHPGLVAQVEGWGHQFLDYNLWSSPPGGSVPTEIATLFADADSNGQYGDALAEIDGAVTADVLMLKSCYYTLAELEDPAALGRWEQAFIDAVAPYANQHPQQKLVVMPAVPERRSSGLSAAAAARGRAWSDWLSGTFITTYAPQHNVYSFDLFNLLADPATDPTNANYQREEYLRSGGDSHPNDTAYSAAADAIAAFLQPLLTTAAPTFSIGDVKVTEGNAGTSRAVFTVTRSNPGGPAQTVKYATADGTGVAGIDYRAVQGTLQFAPGQASKTITVSVVGDPFDEDDHTFLVRLSSAADVPLAAATGTILDNDAAPAISIGKVSLREGNAGSTNAVFTVKLAGRTRKTVTMDYATADGTATQADADYVAAAGTVTFAPGVTRQTVAVRVNGDAKYEASESFQVSLTNPVNGTLLGNTAIGSITNDDTVPKLSIADITVNESAGTAIFTVSLSAASGLPVSVVCATANKTAVAPGDYTASRIAMTFVPGVTTQTFVVPLNNDAMREVNETFLAKLTGPTGGTIARSTATATILDDDALLAFAARSPRTTSPKAVISPSLLDLLASSSRSGKR